MSNRTAYWGDFSTVQSLFRVVHQTLLGIGGDPGSQVGPGGTDFLRTSRCLVRLDENAGLTGLVPDEDQGYMFSLLQLPPAASLERTNAAVAQLTRIARDVKGVDGVASVSGFNVLTGIDHFLQRDNLHPAETLGGAGGSR